MIYPFEKEVLVKQEDIESRIKVLGEWITNDYSGSEGILLLALLRGSFMFLSDLAKSIKLPVTVDFMSVSSYAGYETGGIVRIHAEHKTNIEGWDVILIDDIVDTGFTLESIIELLSTRKPKSLRTCVLLDKKSRREANVVMDYVGFTIPDEFVIGYGLDVDEHGRNLPYIASVDKEKYAEFLKKS